MKIDLSTPEPAADQDAWNALVAKAEPIDTRIAKLSRKDASGVAYPLVAEDAEAQETAPLGNQDDYRARFGKAPTWDVRAVLSYQDEISGNAQILDALNHGATALELRVRQLLNLDTDRLFANVTRSFVELVLVGDKTVSSQELHALRMKLQDFKGYTWVIPDPAISFPQCDKNTKHALSSLEAVDLGSDSALEIAYLLSSAVAYHRQETLESAERNPLSLYVTTESTLFANIAKLRALKRLFEGVRSSLGITKPWELLTLSSPRAWTCDAPWNNQLRATASLMGASIGGATSIGVLPATATIESQRVALTAHSVAALESNLGQVDDPARGSYLIESLTRDLAELSWSYFQALESKGGIGTTDGRADFVQRASQALAKRDEDLAHRRRKYVGVNEFPSLEDEKSQVLSAIENHPRDSQELEALRHAEGTLETRLVTLGTPARHLGRKTFAEHALASGGLSPSSIDLHDALSTDFTGIQILCGHDEDYEEAKQDISKFLESGSGHTFIASKSALKDTFNPEDRLYLGMNLMDFLKRITLKVKEA